MLRCSAGKGGGDEGDDEEEGGEEGDGGIDDQQLREEWELVRGSSDALEKVRVGRGTWLPTVDGSIAARTSSSFCAPVTECTW